jgi:hypothetical protein
VLKFRVGLIYEMIFRKYDRGSFHLNVFYNLRLCLMLFG